MTDKENLEKERDALERRLKDTSPFDPWMGGDWDRLEVIKEKLKRL